MSAASPLRFSTVEPGIARAVLNRPQRRNAFCSGGDVRGDDEYAATAPRPLGHAEAMREGVRAFVEKREPRFEGG